MWRPLLALEHPLALGEDIAQQGEVLEVGARYAVSAEARLVVLTGEARLSACHYLSHMATHHKGHSMRN